MKRILCSYWLSERASWAQLARWYHPPWLDPAQEKDYVEWTYKVRYFWTMSAMESQKAAEES